MMSPINRSTCDFASSSSADVGSSSSSTTGELASARARHPLRLAAGEIDDVGCLTSLAGDLIGDHGTGVKLRPHICSFSLCERSVRVWTRAPDLPRPGAHARRIGCRIANRKLVVRFDELSFFECLGAHDFPAGTKAICV
jgi:hypothetical protein